ncbi:MAG: hypothetical protein A2W75_00495 [Nitrospinae bacterium RIFCSPLOWO2_12_39_15]|nr:MAG: hypothetical protein A2W75_00495 [Nitrospinae bacterium RIFCSPLOWO2_12_39_15]
MKILDLGCGKKKCENSIGIDISPKSKADVIHDLNNFPYPFPDNEFDKVICLDILEHLDNIVKVMEEIYRICKSGAEVSIRVPHFSSTHAYGDPTHRHIFSTESLNFCIPSLSNYDFYTEAKFELVRLKINFWKIHRLNGISVIANLFPQYYEKLFAFIFPAMNIKFILKVLKT